MSNRYDCFIFDLDGVLVDTAKYHFLAWKRLAEELDIPFTEEDNERLKGVSRMASLDIILELGNRTLPEDEKAALATKKNEWYVAFISKMDASEILPGALELLKELKAQGKKVVLGSASKNAMRILDRTSMTDYFDAVIDGTKVSKAKPDPEVFTKGAESVQVPYDKCVVFEDSVAGIEAAKRAGMATVGVGEPENLPKADQIVPGLHAFQLSSLT